MLCGRRDVDEIVPARSEAAVGGNLDDRQDVTIIASAIQVKNQRSTARFVCNFGVVWCGAAAIFLQLTIGSQPGSTIIHSECRFLLRGRNRYYFCRLGWTLRRCRAQFSRSGQSPACRLSSTALSHVAKTKQEEWSRVKRSPQCGGRTSVTGRN